MVENIYRHLAEQRGLGSDITLGDLAVLHMIREYHQNPVKAQIAIGEYMALVGIPSADIYLAKIPSARDEEVA